MYVKTNPIRIREIWLLMNYVMVSYGLPVYSRLSREDDKTGIPAHVKVPLIFYFTLLFNGIAMVVY